MTPCPLRQVSISNFRRIKGSWQIPLDAPIVLIYGANGSGKTRVLAAIELALTGEIRSMRRVDERYTEHLPHHGSRFATIEIAIANESREGRISSQVTVGGDEIKGAPALESEYGQFFAERAYLDQTSLGQLLELYQYTEGNQESALARFVNELLGLDHLDALREGLHAAGDIRRLRKLSASYSFAEREADKAEMSLGETARKLADTRSELATVRGALQEALEGLGFSTVAQGAIIDLEELELLLDRDEQNRALAENQKQLASLIELRGRIRGHTSRPSTSRLNEARAAAAAASSAVEAWRTAHDAPIAALRSEVASLDIETSSGLSESLLAEASALERRLVEHGAASRQIDAVVQHMDNLRGELENTTAGITSLEKRAGALTTGLATLRDEISGEICPVCDRDFSEVSAGHLLEHINRKLRSIAHESIELQAMVDRRTEIVAILRSKEREVTELGDKMLTDLAFEAAKARQDAVAALLSRLDQLTDAIAEGSRLTETARDAATALVQMDADLKEEQVVMSELAEYATVLNAPSPSADDSPQDAWERLNEIVTERRQNLERRHSALSDAAVVLRRLRDVTNRSEELSTTMAGLAHSKELWQQRVSEANRRREIARAVHAAASSTRTAIVHRVFTQSLNDVWRDVFSRLVPSEPFVPAFGIPTTTKSALELNLETIHRSGLTAGTPSMMLSTGNLNTAALSLFIALHLAVKPLLPCLVFDDPIQSMDEVHIAQFAGLLRVLSKRHGRQVVIAVHERELFEYLALELSPAFKGDELITVELGLDSEGSPIHHSTRLSWADDAALAI